MDFFQNAYTLEFFNFTPEQITAEREHLVKSLINRAVDATIAKIETPATTAPLTQARESVTELMVAACQPKLKQLSEMDQRTFLVPGHVLLIKDFELEQQYSSEEEASQTTKLEELKLRYRQNLAMLAELAAEEEKFKAIEPFMEREIEMHETIYEACANTEFRDTYKFAMHLSDDLQDRISTDT